MKFTKEQLLTMAGVDCTKVDYAIPQHFNDELVKLGVQKPPQSFVWSYLDEHYDRPLSLAPRYASVVEIVEMKRQVLFTALCEAFRKLYAGEDPRLVGIYLRTWIDAERAK